MLNLEELARLVEQHGNALKACVREFDIGGRHFEFNRAAEIMGVINLSADSWYRESVCLTADDAIARARVLSAQGAAIVDIGAESTLAHAATADAMAQKSKLLPILERLREEQIATSVETYHAEVAEACLAHGAAVLNLTGRPTEKILRIAAARDAAVIICYVQGENVRTVSDFDFSRDPIEHMLEYFRAQTELAEKCGVTRILIDPGLGFYYRNLQDSAKRVGHQIRVFLNSFRLRELGWPVCNALPHAFEYFRDEVRCAEPFFAVLAALGRTDLFRTHEVPRVRAVLQTMQSTGGVDSAGATEK